MPTAKEFAREVEALALTVTGYQNGKSGQNGLCDCIGLIMGAMARLGRSAYPMHSTNYFARYQMNNLQPLQNSQELQEGHLVYKARSDTRDLNERYQPGGRYYREGDLLDYYHVGVVTDAGVFEITHCTQDGSISGIKRDTSTKGWTHFGELMEVDYVSDKNAGNIKEETMSKTAYVSVPAGTSTANLRTRPDKSAPLIKRVSGGTVVDVLEQADGWAKIEAPDGNTGYMMLDFLKFFQYADGEVPDIPEDAQQEATAAENEVVLALPRSAAEALYNAFMKAGWA